MPDHVLRGGRGIGHVSDAAPCGDVVGHRREGVRQGQLDDGMPVTAANAELGA